MKQGAPQLLESAVRGADTPVDSVQRRRTRLGYWELGDKPHIISLGAGVQSSTLALMAAAGEIAPMPVGAIFADTQGEPASVYEWLKWLKPQLPFPVYTVSKGDLARDSVRLRKSKKSGNTYLKPSLPVFMQKPDGGRVVPMQRQCTETYKIEPIRRQTRVILKALGERECIQWIGISTDEASRMKPSRNARIRNIWPLIDKGMSRTDCFTWMRDHGFPEPPRSACVYCPYHSDEEWLRLKNDEPEEFERAARYEEKLQNSVYGATALKTDVVYLHRSCVPLREVAFSPTPKAPNQFENECVGICGV